ncbi:MAG: hypothetical protein H0T65_01020 [Deltaproteobacteria bacterium]|nr:hypothetical protein [Deltaproteobacteria bacterium]
MLRITSYTVVALTLAACAVDADLETAETSQAGGAGGGSCPKWGCGENTSEMGPYKNWWELQNPQTSVAGAPNSAGMQVLNFQIGLQIYRPEIINGSQLIARHPNGGVVSGANLTNGFFNISTPTGNYRLRIASVNPKATSNVFFWIGPTEQIETYELMWSGPGGSGRICGNPPAIRSGEGVGKNWNRPYEAVLFTGDRYNTDSMRVTHTSYTTTQGWFNIGCAGSVLAKLHFNRHTTAGSTFLYGSGLLQRQAMLKMYVSDVCGSGNSWTHAGTPLRFQQVGNWAKLSGSEFAFESQWGSGGALCMDTHRLGDLYTLEPGDTIYDECPVPACNGSVGASPMPFMTNAYVVSAVPVDPNLP